MNPNEFFYWLQGYIELTTAVSPSCQVTFTLAQADCIVRHIALVMHWLGNGKQGGGAHPQTIARLHEVRTLAGLLTSERSDGMRDELSATIVKIVAAQFEHVIDPQAGDAEQQAKLNAIHSGGHRPDKPVYRC